MKKNQIQIALVILSFLGTTAYAKGDRPCEPVKKACEDAKYTQGGHQKGMGLYKDCLQPLKKGTKTPKELNVTIDDTSLKACQEKVAKRAAKRAAAQ